MTEAKKQELKAIIPMFLPVLFVAATMTANIMSLRMVSPLGIVMDAGTLLYPITFLVRDAIHRRVGKQSADVTVLISALCNAAMFSLFAFTAWMPYDPSAGVQAEYGQVLVPGLLIVAGSIAGQSVGELIDGRIFHRIYRDGKGSHVKACLASNTVSIPIDTVIMCVIAFGFTQSVATTVAAIAANVVIKYIVMIVSVTVVNIKKK